MIAYIFAMDRNRLIGKENSLPWYLPADLAYFKKTTLNHPIIMGRKTFDSMGKALPGRENIVLSRDENLKISGCQVLHSVRDVKREASYRKVFVIGGAEVYKLLMADVTRMYITHIDHEFEGDTYFPEYDESEWQLTSSVEGEQSEANPYPHRFNIYDRRQ